MAGGSFIKEFLVGLGFSVDKSSMGSFLGGIASATIAVKAVDMAVNAAMGELKDMVNSVPDLGKELYGMSRAAKAAGVSMEELQKLEYTAMIEDSSASAVRESLSELSKNAGLAAMGMGRAKVMFEEMNIAVKDSEGKLKNSSTLLKEVGVAVKDMDKGQAKAVLGRIGIDSSMLKMLTKDMSATGAEFDAMFSAAGLQGMEKLAEDGYELGDNIKRIKYAVEMLKKSFISKFIGPVSKAMKELADIVIKNMPRIQEAMKPVVDWALRIGEAVTAVGRQFLAAAEAWAGYIAGVILAWTLLNATFLASPIGIVLGLAAAIALLVDDFDTWKAGGDSLINWKEWEPALTAAESAIKAIGLAIADMGAALGAAMSILYSLAKFDFKGVKEQVKYAFSGKAELPSDKAFKPSPSAMPFSGKAELPSDKAFKPSPSAMLTPPPAAAATLGGGTQIANQNTVIHVNGSGDPAAVGRAVGHEQKRVNADTMRNFKPVAQ